MCITLCVTTYLYLRVKWKIEKLKKGEDLIGSGRFVSGPKFLLILSLRLLVSKILNRNGLKVESDSYLCKIKFTCDLK